MLRTIRRRRQCGAAPVERILPAPDSLQGSGFYDRLRAQGRSETAVVSGSEAKPGDAKPGDAKKSDSGGRRCTSESAKSSAPAASP
jgi:hypothetical protein